MGFKIEAIEDSREFELAEREPSIHCIDGDGLWVRTFNEYHDEVEVTIKGLTPQRIAKHLAPTLPINPADYQPSAAVNLLIEKVINSRPRESSSWINAAEKIFNDGTRHGYAMALRGLVELETGIGDPNDLDGLCADLISDAEVNRA